MSETQQTTDDEVLFENLFKILDGTFSAGWGIMKMHEALKRRGKEPGWKMRAIAKYLEENEDKLALMVSIASPALLQKIQSMIIKRATGE